VKLKEIFEALSDWFIGSEDFVNLYQGLKTVHKYL